VHPSIPALSPIGPKDLDSGPVQGGRALIDVVNHKTNNWSSGEVPVVRTSWSNDFYETAGPSTLPGAITRQWRLGGASS
jgi:hypothetical protein